MDNIEVYNHMHELSGIENGDKIKLLRREAAKASK